MNANFPFDKKPPLWLYWENDPQEFGALRPEYINLCYETIKRQCGNSFTVIQLSPENLYTYLPRLRRDLDFKCTLQQKRDYIKLELLSIYGGAWVNSDVIMLQDLAPYINVLQKHDFVGFGCHFKNCRKRQNGFPQPASWVMLSRPNGVLMTYARNRARWILDNSPQDLYIGDILGRNLLWKCIATLTANTPSWRYYHVNSFCLERDSVGRQFTNERMLLNETITKECVYRISFIPLNQNVSDFPFPDWFLKMSQEEILEMGDLFIVKLFRWSLLDETPLSAFPEERNPSALYSSSQLVSSTQLNFSNCGSEEIFNANGKIIRPPTNLRPVEKCELSYSGVPNQANDDMYYQHTFSQ